MSNSTTATTSSPPLSLSRRVLSVAITLLLAFSHSFVLAQADEPFDFKSLIGQPVNILLSDDTGLNNVDVVQVVSGTKKGTIRSLIVRADKKSRPQPVLASAIAEIEFRGEPLDLEFDAKTKALAVSEEKRQARLAELGKLREKLEAGRKLGWVDVSNEDFAKFNEEEKQFAKEQVEKTLGIKLECIETERWLFFTNLPATDTSRYLKILDDASVEMSRILGVAAGKRLFRSKVPVYFLSTRDLFAELERRLFETDDPGESTTMLHWYDSGRVVINAFQSQDTRDVASNLGFEIASGMLYRFESSTTIPSWVAGGLGGVISGRSTPGGSYYTEAQQSGLARLVEGKSFSKGFFTSEESFDADDFGVATLLIDRIEKQDTSRLRELIVALKAGLTIDEALQLTYRCTVPKFAKRCGVAVGVPNAKYEP